MGGIWVIDRAIKAAKKLFSFSSSPSYAFLVLVLAGRDGGNGGMCAQLVLHMQSPPPSPSTGVGGWKAIGSKNQMFVPLSKGGCSFTSQGSNMQSFFFAPNNSCPLTCQEACVFSQGQPTFSSNTRRNI